MKPKFVKLAKKYGYVNATQEYFPTWIIPTIIAVSLVIIFVFALNYALKKNDIKECSQWERFSREAKIFTASRGMIDQCNVYGIYLK